MVTQKPKKPVFDVEAHLAELSSITELSDEERIILKKRYRYAKRT